MIIFNLKTIESINTILIIFLTFQKGEILYFDSSINNKTQNFHFK